MSASDYTLAELVIAAAAEAWRDAGEVLATGITLVPRLAAGLAKATFNPALMMTDGESHLIVDPVPVGPRGDIPPTFEGWAPYGRIFENLWSGRRHAMTLPVQVDRFGQTNVCVIGDPSNPKAALLGPRGFPGNTVHHPNSFFCPHHDLRTFVEGEVDFVCGAGYNPARWPRGYPPGLDLRLIVTDLAVLDFSGADHAIQVRSLHPGVSFDEVQARTGFSLLRAETMAETPPPRGEQLDLIRTRLDPHNLRAGVFKGNPPGDRRKAA